MGKHTLNSATMRRCPSCEGDGRVDAVKSAIRGNGTKVVLGITKIDCPTCDGAGHVMVSGETVRYYMRLNFTDGSVAVMPRHDAWWQVIKGPNGSAPSPNVACSALDFASQQNHLRRIRSAIPLQNCPAHCPTLGDGPRKPQRDHADALGRGAVK